MAETLIYVDRSEVQEGRLGELKAAIGDLARFIEANEPRLIAYQVHFTEDGREMTVIHAHQDSASLEYHMKVAGPAFPRFGQFVKLLSIDVYGSPTGTLLERLQEKARLLGTGTVRVHPFHAGFARAGDA